MFLDKKTKSTFRQNAAAFSVAMNYLCCDTNFIVNARGEICRFSLLKLLKILDETPSVQTF